MARIQMRMQGKMGIGNLSRIPVKGDYIATGTDSAVEVTQVVLFAPNPKFEAIVFAEPAQQGLLTDMQGSVLQLEEEEPVG